VEAGSVGYTALLDDGTVLFGAILEETGNTITLGTATGERHVVLRSRLTQLIGSGKSIMPEGLEKDLQAQSLADLIAFLRLQTDTNNARKKGSTDE